MLTIKGPRMIKGIRGLEPTSRIKKNHQKEIAEMVRERGFEVTYNIGGYSIITVRKRGQLLLILKWVAKEGWVPELIGPTAHTIKDLDTILDSIQANFDTIKNTQGLWDLHKNKRSRESWMKYRGAQCPFYQKANLWGKVLDDMEDLKTLALKAADLLWDVQKSIMINTDSQQQVYPSENLKRINHEICQMVGNLSYQMVGNLDYPPKKKVKDET